MQVVKGVYECGIIRLLEPVDLAEHEEVMVVITPAGKTGHPAMRYAGMLADLTPEEQCAFEESLKQRLSFRRPLEL